MSNLNESFARRMRMFAAGFGVITGAIGVFTILGWALEGDLLLRMLPGADPAVPKTAAVFLAASGAFLLMLGLRSASAQIAGQCLAGVVLLTGLLGLSGHFFGRDLGLNQFFYELLVPGASDQIGRSMSPTTALSLVCAGAALLLLNARSRRWGQVCVWLCVPPLLFSIIVVIGYGYGVHGFYRVGYYTAMSLPTSLGILGLALGIICARPERKPAYLLAMDNFGGFAARRLVIAALVIPPIVGWWRLMGEQAGLYGVEFGVALNTLITMLLLIVVVFYVTERLGVLDEKVRSEVLRFETMADMIPQFAWSANADGDIDYVNARWREYTGMPAEGDGKDWMDYVHPDERPEVSGRWRDSVVGGSPYESYHRFRRARDETYRWFVNRAIPILGSKGEVIRWFGTSTDIEDQQRKGEELAGQVADREAIVRQLAMDLTETEQRERARLARVLHDDLQQVLVAVKMQLALRANNESNTGEGSAMEGLLSQAIETARSLSKELAPPVLHEHGIGAAFEWLANSARERYGLKVEVRAHEAGEPESRWLRVFLFEVVRELLLNVAKHADTDLVRIALNRDGGWVRLLVEDFGRGFAIEKTGSPGGGFGLSFIRDRIASIGGNMEIDSAPGKGTRIRISVPDAVSAGRDAID